MMLSDVGNLIEMEIAMSSSAKGYKFTTLNGVVNAVYEIKNGRMKIERIDSNESWKVVGSNVVKTEMEHGRTEVTTYSDLDGDGIFTKESKDYAIKSTINTINPGSSVDVPSALHVSGYKFDVTNSTVTAVYEVERGVAHQEYIDTNEAWSLDGGNIVKTEYEHGLIETSVYSDLDGDGVFTKTSKSYSSGGETWTGQSGSDNDDTWNGTYNDDQFFAGNGNDQLTAGYGDDDVYGADGDDRLNGDAGSDHLYGGIGSDVLSGGVGSDHLEGGADQDTLNGGDGDDFLSGGTGNDYLSGNVGSDAMYGEDGDDIVVGGAGFDDLYGGIGNDTFKFLSVYDTGSTAANCDRIYDFTSGDKIDLSAIDAKVGSRLNDAFKFIGGASALTSSNAYGAVWFENGFLYASNDQDIAPEFQLELVGVVTLTANEIVL